MCIFAPLENEGKKKNKEDRMFLILCTIVLLCLVKAPKTLINLALRFVEFFV
jgi:hypothetical protein